MIFLPFDNFSSVPFESLLGFYLLAYISYSILLSYNQIYGYQVLVASGISFSQVLLVTMIMGFAIMA